MYRLLKIQKCEFHTLSPILSFGLVYFMNDLLYKQNLIKILKIAEIFQEDNFYDNSM